jgi:hypothetical protein
LEEEAGAFDVEGVVGDSHGDLGEGDLDGAPVDGYGDAERGGAGRVGGAAGEWPLGVVVEAEGLATEREGAAAVAGGVEVGAAEAGVDWAGIFGHGKSP